MCKSSLFPFLLVALRAGQITNTPQPKTWPWGNVFPVLTPGTGIAHSQWEQKRKAHCSAPGTKQALALWRQTPAVETAGQHRQGDTLAIHVWKSTALLQSSHSSLGKRVAKQPGIPGQFPSVCFLDLHLNFVDGISCFPVSSKYSYVHGSTCSGSQDPGIWSHQLQGNRALPNTATSEKFSDNDAAPCCIPSLDISRKLCQVHRLRS